MDKRFLSALCIMSLSLAGLSGCGESDDAIKAGMTDIKDHKYAEAVTGFNTAMENGSSKRSCLRGLGISYLEQSMYPEAEDCFKRALGAGSGIPDSMDFDIAYYLAKTLQKQDRYEEAVSVYDAILDLRPSERDAVYLRGVCRLELGDHDSALSDFTKTISMDNDDYDRIIAVYQQLADKGYEEEGLGILQGVWDPDHMTNYEMGQISYYLGNNAQAQNYLELARSEKTTSDKTPVVMLLGKTGEKQGDFNYAVSVYRSFLEDHPDNAAIYNRLGICEVKMAESMGDSSYYEAAIADFEAGIALGDPDEAMSLLRNQITAYEYMGDFATAKNLIAAYLEQYPDDRDAVREAQFLSTR